MIVYVSNYETTVNVECLNDDRALVTLEEAASPQFFLIEMEPTGAWLDHLRANIENDIAGGL